MEDFDFQARTRVVFGAGSRARLGELASELGFKRTLLVADSGMAATGYVDAAVDVLRAVDIEVITFNDFDVNPDANIIRAGSEFAAHSGIDSLIGLGGGSSLDCAKGINFLMTNGGQMRDYLGYGKATKDLLPMIGVPTTAGTGSEAQSYALISDPETHVKMACGDPKAAFRVAVLDPELTVSQPKAITATAGFDAIAHAVETYVTIGRNPLSEMYSSEAWRLLSANFQKVIAEPEDLEARGAMQLGAYFAGMAIEHSMLGATHACANPVTAHYGTVHGAAIAILLPAVVRWNGPVAAARYAELMRLNGSIVSDIAAPDMLALKLERFATVGGLSKRLSAVGVPASDLPKLAEDAAQQWTGKHNPRPFDLKGALEVYQWAY